MYGPKRPRVPFAFVISPFLFLSSFPHFSFPFCTFIQIIDAQLSSNYHETFAFFISISLCL